MTLEYAIRLARKWAFGGVCSLREGEAQEYHKMALAALEAQRDGAVPVVRCRECRYSRLPAVLTQKYGEPGTLSCTHGSCNRRNVSEDFFCRNGERKEVDGNG